ncbi:hypothetical protein YWIDRAFT_08445, partial [Streptomyces sp. SceaMP-e96]
MTAREQDQDQSHPNPDHAPGRKAHSAMTS